MQAESTLPLPRPDVASEAHSLAVRAHIVERIREEGGLLSFAEFMHHALYAPGLGYYVAGNIKLGPEGDFVTAPEVSSLFGRTIARQVAPTLAGPGCASILEVGAGSGKLAVDVMRKLKAIDALPERYLVLEASPELAARQRARIDQELPGLAARFEWLADWPRDFRGVILANEVLDALPVERFRRDGDRVLQQCVGLAGERFVFDERPAPGWLAADVAAIEHELGREFAAGYIGETCPAATQWMAELAASLAEGLVMIFDYGVARHEYYAVDRPSGWLRCHFRHHAHSDPLILTGIQDITAWVDFSRVAHAGVDAGLELAGYQPQAQFLLGGGLVEEVRESGPGAAPHLSREIKLLTLPGEMGEHFKCMGFAKGAGTSRPAAFAGPDHRHRL